ncbi:MAG: hypothetical protein AB4038_12770 [Prochloraceae cyanobacterium]
MGNWGVGGATPARFPRYDREGCRGFLGLPNRGVGNAHRWKLGKLPITYYLLPITPAQTCRRHVSSDSSRGDYCLKIFWFREKNCFSGVENL